MTGYSGNKTMLDISEKGPNKTKSSEMLQIPSFKIIQFY